MAHMANFSTATDENLFEIANCHFSGSFVDHTARGVLGQDQPGRTH